MPAPDIAITLPSGWSALDNPGGPVTYSPDDGGSVLQLSSPSWGNQLRGQPLDVIRPLMTKIVEGGKLGRVVAMGEATSAYGRMIRAEVDSDDHEEVMAWLLIPATHDVVMATWISGTAESGATAVELIASARPGLLSTAIASAIEIAGKALAAGELAPHAVLYGAGELVYVPLASLPQEIWDDACRVERARVGASVVLAVFAATANKERDVALVYAESATRHRQLVVGEGAPFDIEAKRRDLFRPGDARVAAALAAARQPT